MFVGKSGLVDANKIGGQNFFKIAKPVLNAVVLSVRIDGDHFSVEDGDAFDFRKCEFSHLILSVPDDTVRTGIIADQVFDLFCQ